MPQNQPCGRRLLTTMALQCYSIASHLNEERTGHYALLRCCSGMNKREIDDTAASSPKNNRTGRSQSLPSRPATK